MQEQGVLPICLREVILDDWFLMYRQSRFQIVEAGN